LLIRKVALLLETGFIKQIRNEKMVIPEGISDGEVQQIVKDLMKAGVLKIVEIRKYAFEVDEEKLVSEKRRNSSMLKEFT